MAEYLVASAWQFLERKVQLKFAEILTYSITLKTRLNGTKLMSVAEIERVAININQN